MKLAAIIVAYKPDVNQVIKNVLSYSDLCDIVILWDNTEGGKNDWSPLSVLGDKLIIQQEEENVGLAKAYNKGIEYAKQHGCTHIMTMDHDSTFERFEVLRYYVDSCNDVRYGMFCPPINDSQTKEGELIEVNDAVQSGCIFSLDMIKQIGGFREDFFIGMVDVEMQLRAAEHGFRIAQVGGCNLIHHIGSGRRVRFMNREIMVSDYGPLRHYYDSRNRILMWKEFSYDFSPALKLKHLRGRLHLCVKILLFEDNKHAKVNAIVRGTINGLLNRITPY